MRPLEIVLSTIDLVALGSLAIARLRAMRWTRLAVPVAFLLAVAQVVVEGSRWQLAPAYALTIALVLIWLVHLARRTPRIGRSVAALGTGLGVLAILTTLLLGTVLPVFDFPEPTGQYAVGTTTHHWVDRGRPELLTADPDDHRELMAQIWYPAEPSSSAPRAPYISDSDTVIPALARRLDVPEAVLDQLDHVTTDAVPAAPVAADDAPYPVIFVLGGLGGFRAAQTFQILELVSHGYVVVGLDQPGAAVTVRFPDGRRFPGWTKDELAPLINQSWWPRPEAPTLHGRALPDGIYPYFGADVGFALDRLVALNRSDPDGILTGRLDLDHVGLSGISFGGAAGAEACANDRRIGACFIMDVQMTTNVLEQGLTQPTMFMTRDPESFRRERETSGGWPNREIAGTIDTMTELYEDLPAHGYYVEIPGLFHVDFTDLPVWSPITRQLGMNGTIDGRRAHQIINAYSLAFFDKHLRDRSPDLLDGPSDRFLEARLERHDGRP